MRSLPDRLTQSSDFLLGVELVSTRGTTVEPRAAKTVAFARELADYVRLDWVSITDNAGGTPMLSPLALARPLRDAGRSRARQRLKAYRGSGEGRPARPAPERG